MPTRAVPGLPPGHESAPDRRYHPHRFRAGLHPCRVIKYDDYVALGSEKACRDQGKIGVEGKEYVVQDGDIMHFLFNV